MIGEVIPIERHKENTIDIRLEQQSNNQSVNFTPDFPCN